MADPGVESIFDANVRVIMTQMMSVIMEQAKTNASSKGLPDEIGQAMSVTNFKRDGKGQYSIELEVDLEKAPMARAFEFGSGIHATRGARGKYPIVPKEASMLAFEWNPEFIPWGSPKFIGLAGKKYLFRKVDHPGVSQKAFLIPAIEQKSSEINSLINSFLLNTASVSFSLVLE